MLTKQREMIKKNNTCSAILPFAISVNYLAETGTNRSAMGS